MSKISISEAIRLSGVSRSHFYKKYINTGSISVLVEGDKKLIDVSELIRVFGNIQLENTQNKQLNTSENTINTMEKDKLISLLEAQLTEAKTREKAALEREAWLQAQISDLKAIQTKLLEDKTDKTIKKRKKFLGIF